MISLLLDLRAWSRDIDYLTALVRGMTAAEKLDRELLITATAELQALSDTPVEGYRRTRRARHALWRMAGIPTRRFW